MAEATYNERLLALEDADYVMFDENEGYALCLGEMAQAAIYWYDGNLKNLRKRAEQIPERERTLLMEFNGIGDLQADVFLREVQLDWKELYPYITQDALDAALALDIADDGNELARISGEKDFPRLVAALEQVEHTKDYDEILEKSRQLAFAR